MRQIIPFTKNIEFKTMINEITNISLEHTLCLNDTNNVSGDFLITGKYKINQSSPTEDDFSYKIPIDISIDPKYKTENIELEIDDFKYEKVDSNKLKVDIDLSIDNLEKKEELKEQEELEIIDFEERKMISDSEKEEIDKIINSNDISDLFNEVDTKQELIIENKIGTLEHNNNEVKPNVGSLFEAFKDTEETFSTYSVYIVRNGDSIDEIISKYKTTRELLEEYNDMNNIKIGTKVIIPNTKNENDK